MKPGFTRRIRRNSSASESALFRKENRQEQTFFSTHDPFFQPAAAIQRKCEQCEEEDKKVQRKSDREEEEKKLQKKEAGSGNVSPVATASVVSAANDSGSSLPASLQNFFSRRLHYDFRKVKVHTGTKADQSAKSIRAQAFTYNNHIVFADGKYQPETREGKHLLAHELTHVMQQQQADRSGMLSRKAEDETILPEIYIEGFGANQENQTAYGCANVSVQGQTDANYSNSFSSSLSPRVATSCDGCEGEECIRARGTLVSVFQANPTVTLPNVPSGLSECEEAAVSRFINTTLRRHELQHVAAFNTYNATIRTRINYTGCRDGLDAHLQNIHDGIEQRRRSSSDARSAALDPFNATIPCNCD
jgi:hypothetical protein